MQQNETLKLRMPEAHEAVRTPGKVQSPEAEAWIDRIKKDLETVKEKEKTPSGNIALKKEMASPESNKESGWLQKLNTAVADMGRDIVTANDMAKAKFDGDSALMHAARGGMTTLVGIGFDELLDGTLSKGIKQGEVWINKTKFPLGSDVVQQLTALGESRPRIRYFIESATKNFITGLAYNTTAYFSGRALPIAEPKHFLSSLVASAVESAGPKGQDGVKIYNTEPLPEDPKAIATFMERQATEAKAAYENAPRPQAIMEEARKAALGDLERNQELFKTKWAEAKANKVPGKDMLDLWPLPLSKRKIQKAKRSIAIAAMAEGRKAEERIERLSEKAYEARIKADQYNHAAAYSSRNTEQSRSNWKAEAQKLIKYANPATLLGIDWMTDGVAELVKNTKAVRKVRKEKGIVGKSVDMPQADTRRNYFDRKPYDNKRDVGGKPQYKSAVYYGKSTVQKAPEEIDYAKLM